MGRKADAHTRGPVTSTGVAWATTECDPAPPDAANGLSRGAAAAATPALVPSPRDRERPTPLASSGAERWLAWAWVPDAGAGPGVRAMLAPGLSTGRRTPWGPLGDARPRVPACPALSAAGHRGARAGSQRGQGRKGASPPTPPGSVRVRGTGGKCQQWGGLRTRVAELPKGPKRRPAPPVDPAPDGSPGGARYTFSRQRSGEDSEINTLSRSAGMEGPAGPAALTAGRVAQRDGQEVSGIAGAADSVLPQAAGGQGPRVVGARGEQALRSAHLCCHKRPLAVFPGPFTQVSLVSVVLERHSGRCWPEVPGGCWPETLGGLPA